MSWNGNDKIFRTYVKGIGDGKKPATGGKGKSHISNFDEVEKYRHFGAFLIPGYIDVSFDSKEMYKAFLQMAEDNEWRCLALSSAKGGHTYWKCNKRHIKSGKDIKLAVGFIADIHGGDTYIPLKVDGVPRYPPDYDILEDEDYQEIPDELLPIDRTTVNLWQMEDGEGRNQEMFRYIQRLQAVYHFSPDVIRRILNNANDYVLADPLPSSELDTITRDEAFNKPVFFGEKNTFLHSVFADWLKKEHHIVNIDGSLHVYFEGVYTPDPDVFEYLMLQEISHLKRNQRLEVMSTLNGNKLKEVTKTAPAKYIAFKNGILDITTGEMHGFSPGLVITNVIPHNYNPAAYSSTADRMLNNVACGDPTIRALLEECIGHCFFRSNELRKAFLLVGGKRGGKSTYLDCIKEILGRDNVSSLELKEISERFSTAMLQGKLANIGDDIGDDFLQGSQVALFKKVVSGSRIKAERKGLPPFDFDPYVKLIFSANEIPRMKDRGNGALDRMIIIPFNAVFDEHAPNHEPFIREDLFKEESLEYMINLGVEGLKRILNKGFTHSEAVEEQIEEYEEENNPVIAFLKDLDVNKEIINERCKDVRRKYTVFCQENGFTALSDKQFGKQLASILHIRSKVVKVNGAVDRIYVKGDAK